MADPGEVVGGRLDDESVRERLTRLDELLERVEAVPGPTSEQALEAVETLVEVYGEALARVVALAGGTASGTGPAVPQAFLDDELLSHLLVLHGLHPEPVEARVERALDDVRPYVASHGGAVELAAVDGDVARIRLSGSCEGCASSSATLEHAVSDAVLAAAPELAGVEAVAPSGAPSHPAPAQGLTLIPVDALLRRPATAGGAL